MYAAIITGFGNTKTEKSTKYEIIHTPGKPH